MHKSSIYLPDDLKRALGELSSRSGRSEADLIRSAIEHLVSTPANEITNAGSPTPEPSHPSAFTRPCVIGVGMGPGDPGLVTTLARAALSIADRVLVVTTDARSIGRAEMVVRSVAPSARISRVPFAIGADAAGRSASLDGLTDAALAGADAGELVAVALLGDPAQWTIFSELRDQIVARRTRLHVEAIPGITAYQAVAARAASTLGAAGQPFVIVDNLVDLDAHLAHRDACVVLFKASTDADGIRTVAAKHRRSALVGELTGLPGERMIDLAEMPDGPMSYLATVVFPALQHDRVASR